MRDQRCLPCENVNTIGYQTRITCAVTQVRVALSWPDDILSAFTIQEWRYQAELLVVRDSSIVLRI